MHSLKTLLDIERTRTILIHIHMYVGMYVWVSRLSLFSSHILSSFLLLFFTPSLSHVLEKFNFSTYKMYLLCGTLEKTLFFVSHSLNEKFDTKLFLHRIYWVIYLLYFLFVGNYSRNFLGFQDSWLACFVEWHLFLNDPLISYVTNT